MRYFLPIFLLLFLFACKTKVSNKTIPISTDNVKLVFLDSTDASAAILDDVEGGIFDRLTSLDMSIQLKKNFTEEASRESILKEYRNYIQKDVSAFAEAEQKWIQEKWDEAVALCNGLNKSILPSEVKLIRSKGTYYGQEAFFTRKDMIVIPEYNLRMRSENGMLSVLLHEIFHIYSRNNTDKQTALYKHIGFKDIGDSKDLVMPEVLANKILHNPDGLNFAWAIELTDEKNTFNAVPIISSILPKFESEKGDFFNYMHFDLFEVKKVGDAYEVICDEDGQPTLAPETMPSFFEQIGMNTQYIIHPDEILADNFMILALSKKDPKTLENFNEEGKLLLKKIEQTITEL